MIRNYLTLALRNFWKHKAFSTINVLGLAVGISASLVIFLIVQYEFSFDRFHKDGDRIYRVVSNLNFSGTPIENSGVPSPLPFAVAKEIPGLEVAAPFHMYDYQTKVTVQRPEDKEPVHFKNREHILFANDQYFSLIPHQWLEGSPAALKDPSKVVLTESSFKEYFPQAAINTAVGREITYNDSVRVTIAGIVKDLPHVTDFVFKDFISIATIATTGLKSNYSWDQWDNYNGSSQFFVKLAKGIDPQQTAKKITALAASRSANDGNFKTVHVLQPLNDLHFSTVYDNFDQPKAHKPTLYGLLLVAGFLLLLGCINFINLTTAQAVQRAKEIGIRKTMGSSKRQLIFQFMSETFLLTLVATLLSIALIPSVMKLFSDYMPAGLGFAAILQPNVLLFIASLTIAVTLLSGFYPSLVLTRFKPVLVLKNQAYSGTGQTRQAWLRKTLTVSQFIIAQFFIIGTLIVARQIHFSLHKDLGYNKEAIFNVDAPWNEYNQPAKKQVLLNKLKAIPGLQQVVLAGKPPASPGTSSSTYSFNNGKEEMEKMIERREAGPDYFPFYKLKLVAGHYITSADTIQREYVVNEAFVKAMGLQHPQDVIGKNIGSSDKLLTPIVGVLADFHTKSLHQNIKPLIFEARKDEFSTFHILLPANGQKEGNWKQSIAAIEKAWKEVYPEYDFKYSFLDEKIASFYETEQKTSSLLTWASGLAIFISCLGLLGLVIFTTHRRVKEIGVRKVLGASVSQIVSLLSKDFILLVLLAFVITVPIAWWAANSWLQNFAYRSTMPWWIYVAGGVIMVLIALLTLSVQTIRAALANPVKALRSE